MLLHEFQAKKLIKGFGIASPMGDVAASVTEAREVAERLGCRRFAVKAQLLCGDRAERNAIRYASSAAEVGEQAAKLIGHRFETPGGRGQVAQQVLVEEFVEADRELYVAMTVERSSGQIVLLASGRGGSGIEERAQSDPDLIVRSRVRLEGRRAVGDFAKVAEQVSPDAGCAMSLTEILRNLASGFVASDATTIDINPLVLTRDRQLVAVDAKAVIDGNAMSRHPELVAMRLENERIDSDLKELEAQRYQINFLSLDGDIGVAVNGAGLALATHDMIVDAGGSPSNFMDIRTTARSLDIAHGFEMLLQNPATKAILVNVHGGGMQRCDTIAEGLGIALRRRPRKLPIVIRMAGNNAQFARTVLTNNGVQFYDAASMTQAVERVVQLCSREAA